MAKELHFICPFCGLLCCFAENEEEATLGHEFPLCPTYVDNDVETYMELAEIEVKRQDARERERMN